VSVSGAKGGTPGGSTRFISLKLVKGICVTSWTGCARGVGNRRRKGEMQKQDCEDPEREVLKIVVNVKNKAKGGGDWGNLPSAKPESREGHARCGSPAVSLKGHRLDARGCNKDAGVIRLSPG